MILSANEVDRLVKPRELVETVKEVLLRAPRPPQRVALEHEDSWLGIMPAIALGKLVVKVVGVFPKNAGRGLPLVRGSLLLFDAESGEKLLEADAGAATGWRTAAASALALSILGYRGGTLGIIGAGVQGRYHARVIKEVLGFDELLVTDKSEERARSLASSYGGRVASLDEVLSRSDAVVAATTSREPVVLGERLRAGAFVASVGAPRPVRELDEAAIKRSRCLLVDTEAGVRAESEDWVGAESIVELPDALRGKGCSWGDVRIYKSVGYSLLDAAIAIHLYELVRK